MNVNAEEQVTIVEADLQQIFADEIANIWGIVFASTSLIVKQAAKYGFTGIGDAPAPNIHDVLTKLKMAQVILEDLLAGSEGKLSDSAVEHSVNRQITNSKQQIFHLEQVVNSLKLNDADLFHKSVECLKNQPCI